MTVPYVGSLWLDYRVICAADTGLADERVEIMAEEEVSEADLSGRLATVLEEIRDVMEKRKQRIEELRQEITNIENDNDELEKTISELLDSFG